MSQKEPIAIVGMGCRLSGGANDPQRFWELLCAGFDACQTIPRDRWDWRRFYSPDVDAPGKVVCRAAAFVDQRLHDFDPDFFGVSAREAAALDPQQRLLLETTWEALEDALWVPADLECTDTGVFIGVFNTDHGRIQASGLGLDDIGPQTATSVGATMLSARLAHVFDFRGPTMSVDTACSSSLVAIHLACRSIWAGECSAAVAGGANLMLCPMPGVIMSKGHFISPDGRSWVFDARANGYGRGDGVAVVLLRPLREALAQGDRIYAVIEGTGINQDGRTPSIAVPNAEAQIELMRRVARETGSHPIQYMEAHGTGTPVGDPIEARSISEALARPQAAHGPLVVGSVKANLGHTEAAAGVAGLMRAVLSIYHGKLVPQISRESPNPDIPFDELGLRTCSTLEDWPETGDPRRAAVNSFGYGGTNAHVRLRQAPEPAPASVPTSAGLNEGLIFPLSARSPEALRQASSDFLAYLLGSEHSFADLMHTACRHRSHHRHRLGIVSRSRDELRDNLRGYVESGSSSGVAEGEVSFAQEPRLAYVYTGMGPQWWGMGRELEREVAVFARALRECFDLFSEHLGYSLAQVVGERRGDPDPPGTQMAQILNVSLQIALGRMWASWDVEPDMAVGHSVGEIPAAHLAGCLDLEDAVTIAFHRSRLQSRLEGRGDTMLALEMTLEELADLAGHEATALVAAHNAPRSLTLAGPRSELESVAELAESRGVFARFLQVAVPYHSAAMDPLHDEFMEAVAGVRPRPPKRPLYSTVTGARIAGADHDAAHWWRNIRAPVQFEQAVTAMLGDGASLLLQVGPHPVLSAALNANNQRLLRESRVLYSLRRGVPEQAAMLHGLASLYGHGYAVNWDRLAPRGRRVFDFPRYPWQRRHHWHESAASREDRMGPSGHLFLGQRARASDPTWHTGINENYFPYLAHHKVQGQMVFPAAGFLEMAFAIAQHERGDSRVTLQKLAIEHALVVPQNQEVQTELRFDPASSRLSIRSARRDGDRTEWTEHARGTVLGHPMAVPSARLDVDAVAERCEKSPHDHYEIQRERGLEFGPRFRVVEDLRVGDGEFLARVRIDEDVPIEEDGYLIHPILLDGAAQSLGFATEDDLTEETRRGIFLPVTMERIDFVRSPGRLVHVHGHIHMVADRRIVGDVTIYDADGEPCLRLLGVQLRFLSTRQAPSLEETRRHLYEVGWLRVDSTAEPAHRLGPWLVLTDDVESTTPLARALGDRAQVMDLGTKPGDAAEKALRAWIGPVTTAGEIPHLVFVPGPDRQSDAAQAAFARTADLMGLLRAAVACSKDLVFTCVTRHACAVDGKEPVSPSHGALWGCVRVFALEHPEAKCHLIDVTAHTDAEALATELCASTAPQVAIRNDEVHVFRVDYAQPRSDGVSERRNVSTDVPIVLNRAAQRTIDGLMWREAPQPAPGPQDIVVKVHSAGLNFKDVMKVLSMLPDEVTRDTFYGTHLGMECSGMVVAVGASVERWKQGDDVVALSPGCFTSYLVCDQDRAVEVPPGVGLDEAPALVPFTTAVRALGDLARLEAGETVLIHSATGGVGLACVQLAKARSARILATAGSEAKRDFLRSLDLAWVGDSRSLDFVDEVMAETDGRGVDVVVSALAGEAITKSLEVLAPCGRFIELGKSGADPRNTLPSHPFNENLTFCSVDLDRLLLHRPEVARRLAAEVFRGFEDGTFRALPTTRIPAPQVQEAFSQMARAEHIGKIVVTMADQRVEIEPEQPALFDPDKSYLVTGAFGGFGMQVVPWLVRHGARYLTLVGRRVPESPAVLDTLDELREAGARLDIRCADVSDPAQAEQLFARASPAIGGVFHLAMVLDDALIVNMDRGRLHKVMAPKAAGAWNLHRASLAADLDVFVLFSSISSLFGAVGQASYAAANAFLDALSHARRAMGLPAISVNWGALAQAGVVARDDRLAASLEMQGVAGMSNEQVLAGLELVLREDLTQAGFTDMDWGKRAAVKPELADSPHFGHLIRAAKTTSVRTGARQILEALEAGGDGDARSTAIEIVRQRVAAVMRVDPENLDVRRPMRALGTDSLIATEMRMVLLRDFGVEFSAVELMQSLSVSDMADRIADRVLSAEADPASGLAVAPPVPSARVPERP